jgi:hypothetical protein
MWLAFDFDGDFPTLNPSEPEHEGTWEYKIRIRSDYDSMEFYDFDSQDYLTIFEMTAATPCSLNNEIVFGGEVSYDDIETWYEVIGDAASTTITRAMPSLSDLYSDDNGAGVCGEY